MVVPAALRITRLRPGRKYCELNRISHELGWKYSDVVATLEEKRKTKGKAYYEKAKVCTLSSLPLFFVRCHLWIATDS